MAAYLFQGQQENVYYCFFLLRVPWIRSDSKLADQTPYLHTKKIPAAIYGNVLIWVIFYHIQRYYSHSSEGITEDVCSAREKPQGTSQMLAFHTGLKLISRSES